MAREYDIGKALAYQVKREMAERYFSARKTIEDDITMLHSKITELSDYFDFVIASDFLRLYSILVEKDLIDKFLEMINLKEPSFYDDYMIRSKNIKNRLLMGFQDRGWTSYGKFHNRFKDSYLKLFENVMRYNEKVQELIDFENIVKEETALIKTKFSLDEMMCFMRELDREDVPGVMTENICCRTERLEDSLGFIVPDVKSSIHFFPPLPLWKDLSPEIGYILKPAFNLQK
jgi:hypothetical protein